MRGLFYYIAAFAAVFFSANAVVAASFVAPAPVLEEGNRFKDIVVEQSASSQLVQPVSLEADSVSSVVQSDHFVAPSPLITREAAPALIDISPSQEEAKGGEAKELLDEVPQSSPQEVTEPIRAVADVAVLSSKEDTGAWQELEVALRADIPTNAAVVKGLDLQQALEDAYNYNPRLVAERERQRGTDEQVSQALAGFRPSASVTIDKGRQRTSFNGSERNYGDSDRTDFRVEQPIFRGGGTVAGYQAAKQQVQAGRYALVALEQQILFDTIEAYMDVVQAQSILDIARNNESVLREQLKASQERFDVGEVTRTDVAQSEARLSNASAQVIQAEGELISAVAGLENYIGKRPGSTLKAPATLPELPSGLTEALEIARAQNPQLLRSLHEEKASRYDIRRNVAGILPSVSLVGSVSKQEGAGVLGTTQFNQDSLRLNISVPLYQSGAEYSRVRQAKAVRSQRKFERLNTRLAVDAVVTQAWEALETSIATIEARKDQIKAAEVALEGVKQEQLYGARTVLDVLDAEQELFIARSNLVRAERDRVVTVFNLLQAVGHLTPVHLALHVPVYDVEENYDRVKWLPIGF